MKTKESTPKCVETNSTAQIDKYSHSVDSCQQGRPMNRDRRCRFVWKEFKDLERSHFKILMSSTRSPSWTSRNSSHTRSMLVCHSVESARWKNARRVTVNGVNKLKVKVKMKFKDWDQAYEGLEKGSGIVMRWGHIRMKRSNTCSKILASSQWQQSCKRLVATCSDRQCFQSAAPIRTRP